MNRERLFSGWVADVNLNISVYKTCRKLHLEEFYPSLCSIRIRRLIQLSFATSQTQLNLAVKSTFYDKVKS